MPAHRDYREIDREIAERQDELESVSTMTETAWNTTHPNTNRRDHVMALTGEVRALDRERRAAYDHERAQIAAVSRNGHVIGGESTVEAYASIHAFIAGDVRAATLTTAGGSGGNYMVPEPLHAVLLDKVRAADPIYAGATHFDLSGGNSTQMMLPIKTAHGVAADAAETDARTETDAPTFGSVTLECFDKYAYYWASRTWFDSVPDSERLVIDALYGDLFDSLAADFAVGDASGNSAGLFANTGASGYQKQLSSTASSLDAGQFLAAYLKLPAKFRAKAQWLMRSATLASLAALAYPGLNDTPLVTWDKGVAYIMGRPVAETENAPAMAAQAFPVAIADVEQAYAIGTHTKGVFIGVDGVTAPQTIKTYGLARVGGVPWNAEAAVLLKQHNA